MRRHGSQPTSRPAFPSTRSAGQVDASSKRLFAPRHDTHRQGPAIQCGGLHSGDTSNSSSCQAARWVSSSALSIAPTTSTISLDDIVQLGYTFYNAIPDLSAPKSKVKEAFAEIRCRFSRTCHSSKSLEVSAAARVSDYNLGNTGTVWAYNGNALWSPMRGSAPSRQLCPCGPCAEPGRAVHTIWPELSRSSPTRAT